jgi:hypothetical protein
MTSAIPCAAGENRADGIGKRAASGKERDDLPRLEAKSILNCCPNWDMPLDDQPFSRLRVCCARYAHEYMGMEDGADFKQEGRGGRAGRELSSARLRQHPLPWTQRQIPTNSSLRSALTPAICSTDVRESGRIDVCRQLSPLQRQLRRFLGRAG